VNPSAPAAAAAEEFEDGEEDVDRVEVDGEGQRDGGLAVAAGADAGEVAYGEEGEDAEGEPGVGIKRYAIEPMAAIPRPVVAAALKTAAGPMVRT